jgi:Fur family ferric uptake transcriptional regulator
MKMIVIKGSARTMGRCERDQTWWHGRFKGCGYKITIGRETILQVLSDAGKHLSADEIYTKVHVLQPAIGLTSVYRTLEILKDMGLVHKFDFDDGRARYELAEGEDGKDHHHHLVCKRCKRVVDYTDFIDQEIKLLNDTEKALSKKYNFDITNHLIQFYGVCGKCRGK